MHAESWQVLRHESLGPRQHQPAIVQENVSRHGPIVLVEAQYQARQLSIISLRCIPRRLRGSTRQIKVLWPVMAQAAHRILSSTVGKSLKGGPTKSSVQPYRGAAHRWQFVCGERLGRVQRHALAHEDLIGRRDARKACHVALQRIHPIAGQSHWWSGQIKAGPMSATSPVTVSISAGHSPAAVLRRLRLRARYHHMVSQMQCQSAQEAASDKLSQLNGYSCVVCTQAYSRVHASCLAIVKVAIA